MHVTSRGSPLKVNRNLCKEAIRHYGKFLFSSRLYNNLNITLIFKPRFDDFAMCAWEDDSHRPREFTITIDGRLGLKSMLIALAHEMVHVKQFAKSEMVDMIKANHTRWNGKMYGNAKVYIYRDENYWSMPWEREARALEHELYVKLLRTPEFSSKLPKKKR